MEASADPAPNSDQNAAGSVHKLAWTYLPDMPQLTGATIPEGGRTFYAYSPSTILKLTADNGEAIMTALAHEVLGSVAPRLEATVSITQPSERHGILVTRQTGTPLVELWPTLRPEQRSTVKTNLTMLILRMRLPNASFNYYGRPGGLPYVTMSEFGPPDEHSYCLTRSDWDASRVRAVRAAASEAEIDDDRIRALEVIQFETKGEEPKLVDSPVLTHGDLSDRNILVEPGTLQVTGLIDWETANVAPAYFEYAAARLSGGHEPEWRVELLAVLREVLRIECERCVTRSERCSDSEQVGHEATKLFQSTLVAWQALVDVERAAQGYSDDCYWTFEDESQPISVGDE